LEVFDIGSIDEGDFYVKFRLRNKDDDFSWILVAVYGAAQNEFKEAFLAELVQTCAKENLPLLAGGDFNIIRNQQEIIMIITMWPFPFNAVIDSLDLRELGLSNRKITWANSRSVPTFGTFDRILVTTEWEAKFPVTTVQALTREISDHTPLLMNTRSGTHSNKQPLFKFELSWLLREGFSEMVTQVWKNESRGRP
jgi:hypothetical protein